MQVKMLSHQRVQELMNEFILKYIDADKKRYLRSMEGFDINKGGRDICLITSIKGKQAPALENTIQENTEKGIATAILFAKSCKDYAGNCGKRVTLVDSEGHFHNYERLTTAKKFVLDQFGEPLYDFNPLQKNIEAFLFGTCPHWAIAKILEIKPPYGEQHGDEELREKRNRLRREYGKGNVLCHFPESEHNRLFEISKIFREKPRYRGVFRDWGFIEKRKKQGDRGLQLKVYRTDKGLLYARFEPLQKEYKLEIV